MTQPTLVIVHGAWHVPDHWIDFMNLLSKDGYEVHSPHLPTCGDLAARSDLADDVYVVRELLVGLTNEGKKIIVIAHSYGGTVATQALHDMSHEERRAKGLPGGVLHIVYMCAYMIQAGESTFGSLPAMPDPSPFEPAEDGTSFLCHPPKQLFYGDVEDGLARRAEALLVRHSLKAFTDPIDYPAWKDIPTTYLECTEDRALPLDWQRKFIKAVRDRTSIEVQTFESSHSPFLSMPVEMVNVIKGVSAKYD